MYEAMAQSLGTVQFSPPFVCACSLLPLASCLSELTSALLNRATVSSIFIYSHDARIVEYNAARFP